MGITFPTFVNGNEINVAAWASLSNPIIQWANGFVVGGDLATGAVKDRHVPNPEVYGYPKNGGETTFQAAYERTRPTDAWTIQCDQYPLKKDRYPIWRWMLPQNNEVPIPGLCRRFFCDASQRIVGRSRFSVFTARTDYYAYYDYQYYDPSKPAADRGWNGRTGLLGYIKVYVTDPNGARTEMVACRRKVRWGSRPRVNYLTQFQINPSLTGVFSVEHVFEFTADSAWYAANGTGVTDTNHENRFFWHQVNFGQRRLTIQIHEE